MVGNDRKIKIINIIIYCLLILFLLSIIYIIYVTHKKYDYELSRNVSLNKELNSIRLEYNDKKEISNNLLIEINNLNNIDSNIINAKNETFKLAMELEKKIRNNESNKKIAYLTFDDGPYYSTNNFLDVLNKYNVKATFFTIGLDKEKCYDNRNKNCYELYKKNC